ASLSFLSLRPRPPRSPLFPYTTLFRSYPGWPISVCDSVDLPDPFGPITAWTSPLSIASETPFRICRPSTLARRSLISKSANSLRSEEHTSELQSPYDLVCRLLLEKKKN